MPKRNERLINEKEIALPNGYKIFIRREEISHVGRSIFRDFESQQFVLEIVDPDGKRTNRLPLPAFAADQVGHFIQDTSGRPSIY